MGRKKRGIKAMELNVLDLATQLTTSSQWRSPSPFIRDVQPVNTVKTYVQPGKLMVMS